MAMELDAEALEQLVAAARQPGGGDLQRLGDVLGCMRLLLAQIQQAPSNIEEVAQEARQHRLLLCLRVARNAAATGGTDACGRLLALGLLDLVRSTLDLVGTATISLNWQLPAAVAQALANLCTACASSAAAAWAALFPLHLSMLAHVNAGATQAATCLALLTCCKVVPRAASALAGPQGSEMLTALLCNQHRQLQQEQGEHIDNLCLLVAHLSFHQDLLPGLFDALAVDASTSDGSNVSKADGAVQPTMAQAALLQALCAEAHDMPQAEGSIRTDGGTDNQRNGASARFLVQLIEQLAAHCKATGGLIEGQQQVLQDTLHLIRDICARDDSGQALAGSGDLVQELQAAGFLPAVLAMLKALDPIQNPRQQRQQQQEAGGAPEAGAGSAGGIQVAELAPQLAEHACRFPATPPYYGFRTDLIAVVSNAAHGRSAVQREVQELGGVELVLAQCQLDRQSPLAREWALWGVRNLCEGNPQAQEAIRQLQLCTTVDSEELQQMGVKLELDEQTGKLKVTKREEGQAAAAPS